MKKFLLLTYSTILIQAIVYAQLPSGSIAPDFTITDIDGNDHNLYEILDQGKPVLLSLFASWCGPCYELYESGIFNEFDQIYGPEGNNSVFTLAIEVDPTTPANSLTGEGNSIGDYTNIINYPLANDDYISESYAVNYYTTIYIICPDRTITSIDQGPWTVDSLANEVFLNTCQYSSEGLNLMMLSYDSELISCGDETIEPKVTILNTGQENISSCSIQTIIDGSVINTYDWTGSLSTLESEQVTLTELPLNSSNVEFNVVLEGDTNTSDNNINVVIEQSIETEAHIDIIVTTDFYPGETSWDITDNQGNIIINGAYLEGNLDQWGGGGPFAENTFEYSTFLNNGCYTFNAFDSYGDGQSTYNNSGSGTQGSIEVIDGDGNTLLYISGNWGSESSVSFEVTHNMYDGCTDSLASNFSSIAIEDNGSCEYYQIENITSENIGSSWNMYTVLSHGTNPVYVNNDLGTISFTHSQNHNLPGGPGVIQTSYSTDGGSTWDFVIQPTNNETQFNSYPSGLILDPTGDRNINNAHSIICGPSTAPEWSGNYFHNFALDGSGGREFLLNNADTDLPSISNNSMMADKNNIIRVLGHNEVQNQLILSTGIYNPEEYSYHTNFEYAATVSYYISEILEENVNAMTPGSWSPAEPLNLGDTVFYVSTINFDLIDFMEVDSIQLNDIEIINNYDANGVLLVSPDTLSVWDNVANIQYSDGSWSSITFEYDSFYVELNGSVDSTLVEDTPGYYWTQKGLTTNGLVEFYDYSMAFNQNGNIGYVVHQGTDASDQILPFVHYSSDGGETWTQLDHDFSVIEDYILPAYNGGIDCTVDKNGDLHMISCLFEGDESAAETNRKLYDIIVNPDDWNAHWITDINTERVLDTDPMAIHGIGYNHRIQAARSSDGSKVFAVWTDVNLEEFGGEIEKVEFPDIYAYGIDVEQELTTIVKNFTKDSPIQGSCFWMFTSPIALDVEGGFNLPTTRSEAGQYQADDPMYHYYVNGIGFAYDDFKNFGCTDSTYMEYNPEATSDNGSCQTLIIEGCSDPQANNYNVNANVETFCVFENLEDEIFIDDNYDYDFWISCGGADFTNLNLEYSISADQLIISNFFNPNSEHIIFNLNNNSFYSELNSENNYIYAENFSDDTLFNAGGPGVDIIITEDYYIDLFFETSYIQIYLGGQINYAIDGHNSYDHCDLYIDIPLNNPIMLGCIDPDAYNFNPNANLSANNCTYYPTIDCSGNTYNWEWGTLDYIGDGYCNSSWTPNFNCEEFDYDGGDCIHGCTDSQSCNYNHEATYNNGTCEYISCIGCLDSLACNYNPNVLINDYETCIYPGELEFIEHTNNLFSQGSDLFSQGTNLFSQGSDLFWQGTNLFSQGSDLFWQGTSVYLQGSNLFTQGTTLFFNGTVSYLETIIDEIYSIFWDFETEELFNCEGCINDINNNDICDEFEIACPYPEFMEYSDNAPVYSFESCVTFVVNGCTDPLAYNFNPDANVDDGSCLGCTDQLANNYSPHINIENNEFCEYLGCTNPISENYNSQANLDDGSCLIYGCTFFMYPNYNPEATIDDGSCSMGSNEVYGCLDPEALNYNVEANIDNGGCEYPLGCPTPDNWQFGISDINHTMMIPGDIAININGEEISLGSTLGVFYTNESGELKCAGYTQLNGEQTFIAIMGDNSVTEEIDGFQEGEEIIWMVWDIQTCQEYQLFPSYYSGSTTYSTNAITSLESLEHTSCQEISLPGGWFMFSSFIIAENMNTEFIMSELGSNLNVVKNNSGAVYLPEYNFNGIGELNFHNGYQINTNTTDILEICGLKIRPEEHTILLNEGWNLIAYLRENPAPADMIFEDMTENDNLIIVKDYGGNPYLPEYNFNGIGNLLPGQGYQLKINNVDTLHYISNDIDYRLSETVVTKNILTHFVSPVRTDNNMTIVIEESAWDTPPEMGSEIGVYNKNGLLVGSSIYSRPVSVITVWGDDYTTDKIDGLNYMESLEFKIWDQYQESNFEVSKWKEGSGEYVINEINIAGAINIKSNFNQVKLFDASPNPSKNITDISFFIPEKNMVNISVYNIVGKLVNELTNSEYDAGTHIIKMNVSELDGGTYFYKMTSGEFSKTKQLVILR